jgi:uncharacterized protein (DUF983 family)
MTADRSGHVDEPGRVAAGQIIARGLTLRCPNCGAGSLARGLLSVHDRCRVCGLLFEREEGFFLGAMVFNYVFAVLIAGVLPCVLFLTGLAYAPLREQITVFLGALAAGLILTVVLYVPSKSLWLMTYYLFLPRDLPANGGEPPGRSRY